MKPEARFIVGKPRRGEALIDAPRGPKIIEASESVVGEARGKGSKWGSPHGERLIDKR